MLNGVRACVLMMAVLLMVGCHAESDATAVLKLRVVKPLELVLNPKPGEIERYIGLQADVDADPRTDHQVLVAFALKLFDENLRVSLDRDAKSNVAFVTFYLGPAVINGQQATKTYRVVFQRKDGQWFRLENGQWVRV
jgi:hypothetical protein